MKQRYSLQHCKYRFIPNGYSIRGSSVITIFVKFRLLYCWISGGLQIDKVDCWQRAFEESYSVKKIEITGEGFRWKNFYDFPKRLTEQQSLRSSFGNHQRRLLIVCLQIFLSSWWVWWRLIKIGYDSKKHRSCAHHHCRRSTCKVPRDRDIPCDITGCNIFDFVSTIGCHKDLFPRFCGTNDWSSKTNSC